LATHSHPHLQRCRFLVPVLNSLGGIEKTVFCEFLLTYIYKTKKARKNNTSGNFDHAILVDEAHNIFLKKPTNFTNETTTDMIYREMREYGTSLICLDQHISKISDTVKGNSACHIAFQQQLPQDIFDISELTQLRDYRHYFSSLPVGSAIVKLSERYNQPFQIKVPYTITRNTNIISEKIKSRMQSFILGKEYQEKSDPEFNKQIEETEPIEKEKRKPIKRKTKNESPISLLTEEQLIIYNYIKAHLTAGIHLKQIEEILEKSKTQGNYASTDIKKAINLLPKEIHKEEELTKDELIFMEYLQKNPNHNLATTAIYKEIKLSARKGTEIKKSLEEKKLIRIKEVKYDKGWKKIIRLS